MSPQCLFNYCVHSYYYLQVEVDYKGQKETWQSGVEIKKCRYLEASGCVGLCVNLCKLPTQKFFTETFGLPLTMNPNFEDLSCEMVFGQYPPPVEEDKVLQRGTAALGPHAAGGASCRLWWWLSGPQP